MKSMNLTGTRLSTILLFVCFITCAAQILPTKLRIQVRNNLGNLTEGVEVTLYGSEEDYNKEINPVTQTQITDKKGRVTFEDLESKVYFVLAEKGELNNYGGGILTDTLRAGRVNKTTIIID
jgi:uncharacterized protein (DUF2141 family)